jgi:hypothetical protein
LISKSFALDFAVIREHEATIKLRAAEAQIKAQEQSLALTQKALSKREFLSLAVISSAVANSMALVKDHMPKFDTEILWKDFTVDDAGQEALVKNAYHIAQHFVSLYDFSILPESDDNASPGAL